MNRLNSSVLTMSLLLLPVSLVGCKSAETIVQRDGIVSETVAQPIELASGDALAWEAVFAELMPVADQIADAKPQSGPSLVAGDWLAFQCAIAGGYWDMPEKEGTPVFAEVPESWFQLD